MKKLLGLFLFMGVVMCSAQEPDVECYSIGYVDSLETNYKSKIDSLETLIEALNNQDEIDVIADTFSFNLVDDRLKIEVKKEAHNVWVNIIDGNKRINSDYVDYEGSVMVMDSTYTVGSLFINENHTKGNAFIQLEN